MREPGLTVATKAHDEGRGGGLRSTFAAPPLGLPRVTACYQTKAQFGPRTRAFKNCGHRFFSCLLVGFCVRLVDCARSISTSWTEREQTNRQCVSLSSVKTEIPSPQTHVLGPPLRNTSLLFGVRGGIARRLGGHDRRSDVDVRLEM